MDRQTEGRMVRQDRQTEGRMVRQDRPTEGRATEPNERLFVLKVCLSSRSEFEKFVWRLGLIFEMEGDDYVISRPTGQERIFKGDYESALRHFASYSIKASARSLKVFAIFHQGDLVMFCDSLETFFARAGRSYVSTSVGYVIYVNGVVRSTHPSLEDAFVDLGKDGWSYIQNITEPGANKLYGCLGPQKAFVGCFPDIQSMVKHAFQIGLAPPPKTKITTLPALNDYWRGLEALGWQKTTPRVVERGHVDPLTTSLASGEEISHMIDQRLAVAQANLQKRAALLKELVKRPGCQLNAAGVDLFFT